MWRLNACSRWKQDAITLIDKLLPESYQEVIIVGGGVGGWIATLIALERPEKGELAARRLICLSPRFPKCTHCCEPNPQEVANLAHFVPRIPERNNK